MPTMDPTTSPEATHLAPGETRRPAVAFVLTHPIQYTVPFLRYLTTQGLIDIHTYYGSDHSVRRVLNPGFNRQVDWGIDLVNGYSSEFLPAHLKGAGRGFLRPMIYGLRKRFKERRPDAVWVSGYLKWISLYAMFAARSLGIPVYVESDSTKYDRPRSRLKLAVKSIYMKLVAALINGCLNVGTWNREYWEQYLDTRRHEFVFFPHSVDNTAFQVRISKASETRDALRKDLDIPQDAHVILFVGRLDYVKGCDVLLCAHRELLSRELPLPYLVFVGDGPQRKEIEAALNPEQASRVRFAGFQDQLSVVRYYDLCSILVLPSRFEPWGLVVNEAMNAAKPVIVSSQVGAGVDLVVDEVNGYRIRHEDPTALADAIERILADPVRMRDFGLASLNRINHWGYAQRAAALTELVHRARAQVASARSPGARDRVPRSPA